MLKGCLWLKALKGFIIRVRVMVVVAVDVWILNFFSFASSDASYSQPFSYGVISQFLFQTFN